MRESTPHPHDHDQESHAAGEIAMRRGIDAALTYMQFVLNTVDVEGRTPGEARDDCFKALASISPEDVLRTMSLGQ